VRKTTFYCDGPDSTAQQIRIHNYQDIPQPWQDLGIRWNRSMEDIVELFRALFGGNVSTNSTGVMGRIIDCGVHINIDLTFLDGALYQIAVDAATSRD
jgi:hypothetical protein